MALALTADNLQLFVTDYKAETIRVITLASAAVRTLTTTPPRTVGIALVSLPDPFGESRHGARVQALYLAAAGHVSRLVFPCSPGYYREGNGLCYRCTAACGSWSEVRLQRHRSRCHPHHFSPSDSVHARTHARVALADVQPNVSRDMPGGIANRY